MGFCEAILIDQEVKTLLTSMMAKVLSIIPHGYVNTIL
jgi:hypothetical protein